MSHYIGNSAIESLLEKQFSTLSNGELQKVRNLCSSMFLGKLLWRQRPDLLITIPNQTKTKSQALVNLVQLRSRGYNGWVDVVRKAARASPGEGTWSHRMAVEWRPQGNRGDVRLQSQGWRGGWRSYESQEWQMYGNKIWKKTWKKKCTYLAEHCKQ